MATVGKVKAIGAALTEILTTVSDSSGLRSTALPSDAFVAAKAIVQTELDRYPSTFALPTFALVGEAEDAEGSIIRARYFPESQLCVLAPALDLRGNVHRTIAMHALAQYPKEAASMRSTWSLAPEAQLYGGRLDTDGEQAAQLGAVFANRASLATAATASSPLAANLKAATEFLERVGLGTDTRSAEAPAPSAWASEVYGESPDFVARPGEVPVRLSPRLDSSDGYNYELVPEQFADEVAGAFERDIWILPEGLLGETIEQVCVVEDVSHPRADIGGYAAWREGDSSTIVIERRGMRQIFFHELGHAIHARYRPYFADDAWDLLVPESTYFGDAKDFIRTGVRDRDFSPSLLERGFITSYSTANKNEDVAEIIEFLLKGDDRLWAALEHSPVLNQKLDIIVSLLQRAHPLLTKTYLRSLTTERHAQEAAWTR